MSKQHPPFVTIGIDGGAATGKSSTSRRIAAKYGLLHVDTGSHYRAIAAGLLAAGVSASDPGEVAEYVKDIYLETEIEDGSAYILVDGTRFGEEAIRSDAVNASVSRFAAMPPVRQALRQYQRDQVNLARETEFFGLVMEGRDIGTVILPDADLLFFLEADEATRAQRRAAEGQQDAIAERDRMDATRKTAPLACSERAERVDTAKLDLEGVVAHLGSRIEALGLKPTEENTSDASA